MSGNSSESFYVYTPSGESMLVEVFEEGEVISVVIGDKRFDLTMESAFDLAEALLMVANDSRADRGIQ